MHIYSPRMRGDNPWGQSFDGSSACLKKYLCPLILCILFHDFIHVQYIAVRQGQALGPKFMMLKGLITLVICYKKVNRKVQGVPQSQTAANPHTKRKRKMTKTNMYKANKQMHEKHIDQLPLPQC